MHKNLILLFLLLTSSLFAQDNQGLPWIKRSNLEGGITASSNGKMHTLSISGLQYMALGKESRKFKVGLGLRLNNSIGNEKLSYSTAPAKLTGDARNIDTVIFTSTQVNALNGFVAIRYDLTNQWGAEFNIDLAGMSFGGEKDGILYYRDGGTSKGATIGKPSLLNLLKVGDRDLGSLNSEFMLSYRKNAKFKFKAGVVFMFNEYSINPVYRYTASNGNILKTERYRTKQWMAALGVNYIF